jgi:sterol desaturase/sphingolipid hydroxylase (fatty acid hydroxylase superfamily)
MDWLGFEFRVRLLILPGLMLVLAWAEIFWPRRAWQLPRFWRWASNLGLALLNTLVLRVVIPLQLADIAVWARQSQLGLLPHLGGPMVLQVLLSIVLLDGIIYGQHVLFHKVPLLWRLHMVHHADLDFDFTTGVRFHTLEMVLSFGIKALAVIALGVPPLGVILFELLLAATSLFNHANIRLPAAWDRWLRLVLVTPEMHRIHHSVHPSELNSNFGFNLPWWDFLFGTYQPQPRDGQEKMLIGLSWLRDEAQADRLPGMLLLPFSSPSPSRENEAPRVQ